MMAFRVTLWILPTAFAVMSVFGHANYSRHMPFSSNTALCLWFLLNGFFVLGTGWFNALLSTDSRLELHGIIQRLILFSLIQPFIIVFFVFIAIVALGMFDPGGSC
ncbi:MAG: hypothetical protein ABIT37_00515 [Luteolibacter sp.]